MLQAQVTPAASICCLLPSAFLLLSTTIDMDMCSLCRRRSCLHYAAGAGHTRCINLLLTEFVAIMQPAAGQQQQQTDGQQAQQQRRRLVLLPEASVEDSIRGTTSFVDLRTRTGFSALHYAAFWGFLGVGLESRLA
jgi:hypothetical protein